MISRAVLVHYRTEAAKHFRRLHGDRGGEVSRQTASPQSAAVEQHN